MVKCFLLSLAASCSIPIRAHAWAKPSTVRNKISLRPTTTALPSSSRTEIDQDAYQLNYLRRIGFSKKEADSLRSSEPNMEDLQKLLWGHLTAIPFENMDQHEHPAHEDTPLIPRRKKLPSLDVFESLDKIVNRNRGGFCYELNFSFNWLLSSLGYGTRIALADVSCNQLVPAHVVILVDGLADVPVLVDVGFGTPGVCNVLLPIQFDTPREDLHGDVFEFKMDDRTDRFDTALYRTRIEDPEVEEPMYRFSIADDMETAAPEFQAGLDRVLTTSPTFNEKRLCVLSDSRGHITLGRDYIKWVEKGVAVKQTELPNETAWRAALSERFGIVLEP